MSKTTVILGHNGVVNGYKGKTEDHHRDWFNFTEGEWNAPVDTYNGPYGDEIYIQGNLDEATKAVELINSLDKGIDQLMVYVGSLRDSHREQWLKAVIKAARDKTPDCVVLIFVCRCADDKIGTIKRLMQETGTDQRNWFEQDCFMAQPSYGKHTMWYYAMVCRRYGQDNMERGGHLQEHRKPSSKDGSYSDLGKALGIWLTWIE